MLNRPIATIIICLAIFIFGWISLTSLSVDLLPSLDTPTLLIRTQWQGASPQEIENRMNEPMEGILSGISGLKNIKSISKQSLSLISLEFEWGQNLDLAFLNTREKLDQARYFLPEDADRPLLIHSNPSDEPIAVLAVKMKSENKEQGIGKKNGGEKEKETGDGRPKTGKSPTSSTSAYLQNDPSTSLRMTIPEKNKYGKMDFDQKVQLKRWVDQILTRRLEQVDGIGQAVMVGAVIPEVKVQYNPILLDQFNLSTAEVEQLIRQSNEFVSTGELRDGWYRYSLKIESQFKTIEELQNLPIKTLGVKVIYLRDVAKVEWSEKDQSSFSLLGSSDVLTVLVKKDFGENTVSVYEKMLPVLQSLKEQFPEIQIDIIKENASFIQNNISNVLQSLIFGGLLAFLILYIYLNDPRLPLTIGISIPVSIFITFIFMYLTGIQLNIISLGGLTLGVGLLVDNSIVVLENISRYREMGNSLFDAALKGTREVAMATTASTLTTISVFIPLAFMGGFEGQLFKDQALTLSFSLIASLVVALTVLPVTVVQLLKKPKEPKNYFKNILLMMDNVQSKYEKGLDYCIHHSKTVFSAVMGLFLIAVLIFIFMPKTMLPEAEEKFVVYRVSLPSNTSLQTTKKIAEQLSNQITYKTNSFLSDIDGNKNRNPLSIGGYSDQSNLSQIVEEGLNKFSLYVPVTSSKHAEVVKSVINLNSLSHPDWKFQSLHTTDILHSLLGDNPEPVSFILIGKDREKTFQNSELLKKKLQTIDSTWTISLQNSQVISVYVLKLKQNKLLELNISESEIFNFLGSIEKGNFIAEWKKGDENIDIRLYTNKTKQVDLSTLTIPFQGRQILLSDIAEIVMVQQPEQYEREKQTPVLQFSSSLSLLDWWWKKAEINDAIQSFSQTTGIQTQLSGLGMQVDNLMERMFLLLLLSVVLIYIILAIQYENLLYPLIILISIPFAWIGSFLLMGLMGTSLNMLSFLGILILTGIAVNDAILKIEFMKKYFEETGNLMESIKQAGHHRFRPVVMTTITTILGLLPMIFPYGDGYELRQSLSIALMGGMISSTILTLFVIPLIFKFVHQENQVIVNGE